MTMQPHTVYIPISYFRTNSFKGNTSKHSPHSHYRTNQQPTKVKKNPPKEFTLTLRNPNDATLSVAAAFVVVVVLALVEVVEGTGTLTLFNPLFDRNRNEYPDHKRKIRRKTYVEAVTLLVTLVTMPVVKLATVVDCESAAAAAALSSAAATIAAAAIASTPIGRLY